MTEPEARFPFNVADLPVVPAIRCCEKCRCLWLQQKNEPCPLCTLRGELGRPVAKL